MALLFRDLCIFLLVFMIIQVSFQQEGEEEPPPEEEPTTGEPSGGETSEGPTPEDKANEVSSGNGGPCGQYVDEDGKIQSDCFPKHMDPFHKPNLRQKLEYAVPDLMEHSKDPRFPWHVELHNRHLIKPQKPILPRSDPNFIKLHYDSRGDMLPQTKRLQERPGPMYTFQGQGAPCQPQYTFEKWHELADDLRPQRKNEAPPKVYKPNLPCIP